MTVLLVLLFLIALATVPIIVGARLVKAEHDSFGRALFAALLMAITPTFVKSVTTQPALAFALAVVSGGFFLSFIMGTTFLRGIAIGAIAAVLVNLGMLLFAGVLIGASAVSA
jgi:hypothetical protein